jgi:hypothetical protein
VQYSPSPSTRSHGCKKQQNSSCIAQSLNRGSSEELDQPSHRQQLPIFPPQKKFHLSPLVYVRLKKSIYKAIGLKSWPHKKHLHSAQSEALAATL